LASSGVAAGRRPAELVLRSAKVAAVSLILCVVLSIFTILALLRGYEEAWSSENDRRRAAGAGTTEEGRLSPNALRLILLGAALSLCSFIVGFLFLGRIAFHF